MIQWYQKISLAVLCEVAAAAVAEFWKKWFQKTMMKLYDDIPIGYAMLYGR